MRSKKEMALFQKLVTSGEGICSLVSVSLSTHAHVHTLMHPSNPVIEKTPGHPVLWTISHTSESHVIYI